MMKLEQIVQDITNHKDMSAVVVATQSVQTEQMNGVLPTVSMQTEHTMKNVIQQTKITHVIAFVEKIIQEQSNL